MQECKEHYETVCQTTYTQKNVLEDRVSCQMKQELRRHVHGYEWKGTLYQGSKKGKHNGLLSFL